MGDGLRTDNLTIPQGETFAREYPVSGVSLDGATARAQVRATQSGTGTLLYTFAAPVIDSVAGTVTVQVPDDDSWAFEWTSGYWDLYVYTDAPSSVRVVGGTVTVSPGVTQPS